MHDERFTHLFTGNGGAPCGVKRSDRWTLVESAVTCPACRALLEGERAQRRHGDHRAVPLGRVLHLG